MTQRILIVEDDVSMGEMLAGDLRRRGWTADHHESAAAALTASVAAEYDLVLTDLNLPGMNGLALCERLVADRPDVPVIVMTAFGSLDTAVSAIRVGAYDFVTKPVDLDLLAIAIARALRHRDQQEQIRLLKAAGGPALAAGGLIGDSQAMQDLVRQVAQVADTETSVLIRGESGTGKELVAQLLHRSSRRHRRPLLALNCAALPANLLESELFGHRRGAFTDAHRDHAGLLQAADGGTLFLDEIGEMSLDLQPKLLRALEERRYRPVGGSDELGFDVRVISATHRDLEEAIEAGRFREDLYYRLNVIELAVPPLRARGTDVLLLAEHFRALFAGRMGKAVAGIAAPAAEKLLAYNWPGNVRELRNAIERAVALARHDQVVVADLPQKVRDHRPTHLVLDSGDPADLVTLAEVERRYIDHVLEATGHNRSQAARILGLDRKTLYRKLRKDGSAEP
ncbi:MAG: sigma-54 dependent transcriptional regulator [Candidatus Krumholzibacteriia bacterium]